MAWLVQGFLTSQLQYQSLLPPPIFLWGGQWPDKCSKKIHSRSAQVPRQQDEASFLQLAVVHVFCLFSLSPPFPFKDLFGACLLCDCLRCNQLWTLLTLQTRTWDEGCVWKLESKPVIDCFVEDCLCSPSLSNAGNFQFHVVKPWCGWPFMRNEFWKCILMSWGN